VKDVEDYVTRSFPVITANQSKQTQIMFAKIKSSIFIDALQLELSAPKGNSVRGILRDDQGSVCSTLERNIGPEREYFTWTGLNDLPYGKYTLELSHGEDELKVNLVKRV
jgi:hypothetical protein